MTPDLLDSGVASCWILDDDNVAQKVDPNTWTRWLRTNRERRRVGLDQVGDKTVSTVFLMLDVNWGGGEPLVFETMVFDEDRSHDLRRYATYAEAVAGHRETVAQLREAAPDSPP